MAQADVAIVHDYLTQRGGAERVVLAMTRAFPDAPIYTSLYCPETTFPDFRRYDVRPLWTDRIGPLRADHRRGLPVYPFAFSAARIDAAVTLCSSSGFAHAVRTAGPKVVYCYTPARWLYDEADAYLQRWPAPVRFATRRAAPLLRAWDQLAMADAHHLLTSSTAVARRIREAYSVGAEVLPPPAGLTISGDQRAIRGISPGFVLSVGRLLAYKNVDALIAAMRHVPDSRLVIVGDGPERDRLQSAAGPNVEFVGEVDDAELRWLYAHCAGVASASFEDYGLTPIEAAAYGKPAAALRFGGFLDTVVENQTGVFFDALAPEAIGAALTGLLTRRWDADMIAAHANRFGEDAFRAHLRAAVTRAGASASPAPIRAVGRDRASVRRPVTTAAGRLAGAARALMLHE